MILMFDKYVHSMIQYKERNTNVSGIIADNTVHILNHCPLMYIKNVFPKYYPLNFGSKSNVSCGSYFTCYQ